MIFCHVNKIILFIHDKFIIICGNHENIGGIPNLVIKINIIKLIINLFIINWELIEIIKNNINIDLIDWIIKYLMV